MFHRKWDPQTGQKKDRNMIFERAYCKVLWYPMTNTPSGWWFGTFFISPNSWDDDPIWLILFKGVETTNQPWFSPMDWFKGKSTWNHGFSWIFPVNICFSCKFPLNQSMVFSLRDVQSCDTLDWSATLSTYGHGRRGVSTCCTAPLCVSRNNPRIPGTVNECKNIANWKIHHVFHMGKST